MSTNRAVLSANSVPFPSCSNEGQPIPGWPSLLHTPSQVPPCRPSNCCCEGESTMATMGGADGRYVALAACLAAFLVCGVRGAQPGQAPAKRVYAHQAVVDGEGVIASWRGGSGDLLDFRVRVAAGTMKRYPWTDTSRAVAALPEYLFSGAWRIAPDGAITIPKIGDWENGDQGQRAAYVLSGLVDYYRYTGDAAAIAHITLQADALLKYSLTSPAHPWPRFLISVPVKGKPYGAANPHGMIQLDIVAEVGLAMLRAYQVTGERRWLDAVKHWADLLAARRQADPRYSPWGRYANPEDAAWEDHQTGGVVFILALFDELIRLGHTGRDGAYVRARDAGRRYVRDVLLPRWSENDTWGRNYWDWPDPVQAENVTEFAARYLMEHPDVFPDWRTDARNILTLFLNRTSVAPESKGGVYSGAWAYPESSGCCGSSLSYGPQELAPVYAQYAALTGSEWAREVGRRQAILSNYDALPTGVVEDNIDGGAIVAGDWFKIAHPMALKHALNMIAWMPDEFAPSGQDHIVRSTSVVRSVRYLARSVSFRTFDAPPNTLTVLRLGFRPTRVSGDTGTLPARTDLLGQGYQLRALGGSDWLVSIRHDGVRSVTVAGAREPSATGAILLAMEGGAAEASFEGNQVRLIGSVGPNGGLADVFIDGEKQAAGIDCWNPAPRVGQTLHYRSDLSSGRHTVRVVARGAGNPVSSGSQVMLEGLVWARIARAPAPPPRGPRGAQRFLLGYTGRRDYVDSLGHAWRPGTEVVTRLASMADSVAATWWTEPRRMQIGGTRDPELYRHGIHARDFTVNFTVGPGAYHVRVKLAETRAVEPAKRAFSIDINGQERVRALDVAATAGGLNRAADLVFDGVPAREGIVAVRFRGVGDAEAIAQAVEIGPGSGGKGASPVCLAGTPAAPSGNLLANGDFEQGVPGQLGSLGLTGGGAGWKYVFAGPSQSYIRGESGYGIHPEWGLPVYHGGKEAIRTHTDGCGHTLVYQEVAVSPSTRYAAEAWVLGSDLHGRGFGTHAGDSAGLWVQELDPGGRIVADHGKATVTKPGPFTRCATTFATGPNTTSVRFVLDTVIGCRYDEGHVTYDDCSLTVAK